MNNKERWSLFSEWVLANVVDLAVGTVALAVLLNLRSGQTQTVTNNSNFSLYLFALLAVLVATGLATGLAVGLGQAWVLKRYIFVQERHLPRDWVAATILGSLAAWFVGSIAGLAGGYSIGLLTGFIATVLGFGQFVGVAIGGLVVGGACAGTVIGLAQSRAFKNHSQDMLGWVWANALAGAGFTLVFGALATLATTPIWFTLVTAIGGAIYGAITGRVVLREASIIADGSKPNVNISAQFVDAESK